MTYSGNQQNINDTQSITAREGKGTVPSTEKISNERDGCGMEAAKLSTLTKINKGQTSNTKKQQNNRSQGTHRRTQDASKHHFAFRREKERKRSLMASIHSSMQVRH